MQILFRRRNHKEEHFERLFAEMYPRLVRFATTLMSNTEEAKDIVSETMEQAWKEFDQLKENTRSAWLYATVRNGCLNRLKHLNVEQQHIDRLIEATRAEMNQGYRAHEALLQQAENIARSLPEPTCTILRSCYWEKKTYQQVADELICVPFGKVCARLVVARENWPTATPPSRYLTSGSFPRCPNRIALFTLIFFLLSYGYTNRCFLFDRFQIL